MHPRTQRIWTYISSAALLLAAQTPFASADERPVIKSIGIVSDVGDKVAIQHIGFMVFSNAHAVQDVSDWAFDAHITSALTEAVKGSYEVHAVDFPRGSIAPDLEGIFNSPSPEDNMRAKAKPADGKPVDAYLVVWPVRRDLYPSNQRVEGLGLLTRGSTANFFMSVRVSLLDGNTGKEIEGCTAEARDRSFWNPGESFMTEAPGFDEIETFDAMTSEQKQSMQSELKKMLTSGMTYCLRDLKLVE